MKATRLAFNRRYMLFRSSSKEAAEAEARIVNAIGIEDDEAIGVFYPGTGWVVILKSEALVIAEAYPEWGKENGIL